MPRIENARCDAGAVSSKFGGFRSQHTRTTEEMQYKTPADECIRRLAGPRFEHLCRQVHALGPRPMAELFAEIATATGEPALIADRLQAYAGLDPEIVRAVGGDRFPPNVWEVVR